MKRWLPALVLLVVATARPMADGPRPFVRGSWQQLLRAHAGRPLIVHLWGLTCAPCLTELPRWGQLVKESAGVDVAFVAADPLPEEPDAVAATLKRAGLLRAENWMFADRFVVRLRFEIDSSWEGELPITRLIDRDGRASTTVGTVDFENIRAWIRAQRIDRPAL